MNAATSYFQTLSSELGAGWNRFWFTPRPNASVKRLRIAVGLLLLFYFLSWIGEVEMWFGPDGLLPRATVDAVAKEIELSTRPSPLDTTSVLVLRGFEIAGVVIGLALTIGVAPRVAALLGFLLLLGFLHRAPLLAGPGETILASLLVYQCFAPSGVKFSTHESSWTSGLVLRLTQVHLAAFYLLAGCSMLGFVVWWNGTAIWQMTGHTLSRPLNLSFIRNTPLLVNLWTHSVVYVTLLVPVLMWFPLWRPLVATLAAIVWLSLILVSGQTFFVLAMLLPLIAFFDGSPWSREAPLPSQPEA